MCPQRLLGPRAANVFRLGAALARNAQSLEDTFGFIRVTARSARQAVRHSSKPPTRSLTLVLNGFATVSAAFSVNALKQDRGALEHQPFASSSVRQPVALSK